MFEIRKNLDLRKILVTPKIFLKLRFHCTNIFHCVSCLIILCGKSLKKQFPKSIYQNHPVFNKGLKWDSIWGIHTGKLQSKCDDKFHHGRFNQILKTHRSTSISEISKYAFYTMLLKVLKWSRLLLFG